MIYLCNTVSKTMFHDPRVKEINEPITESQFISLLHKNKFKSAIGHEPIAKCVSKIVGKNIEKNRINLNLDYKDKIVLISVDGRLPENPELVEWRDKLNFAYVRLEKQTENDMLKTIKEIKELTMEA